MEIVILPYLLMTTVTAVRTETIATQRGIKGGGGVPLQPLASPYRPTLFYQLICQQVTGFPT